MLLDRFFAWNILIFIFFLWWTQSLRWHWHPFGPSVRHIFTKNERLFKKRFSEEVQAGVESACLFRSRQISEAPRLFFSYLWDSQKIVKNLFILKNEKHLSISSATTRILTQPDGKRSQAIHRYAAILDLHFKKSQW